MVNVILSDMEYPFEIGPKRSFVTLVVQNNGSVHIKEYTGYGPLGADFVAALIHWT